MKKFFNKIFGIPKGLNKKELSLLITKKMFLTVILPILILIVTIFLPYIYIEKLMDYNISSSDWLSFYGGYLGAIIGAVGVFFTLYITNKLANYDRTINIETHNENLRYSKIPFFLIEESPKELRDPHFTFSMNKYGEFRNEVSLVLKNIGEGFATDFYISTIKYNNVTNLDFSSNRPKTSLVNTQSDYEIKFNFYLEQNEQSKTEDIFIEIHFSDMFHNTYIQNFNFKIIFNSETKNISILKNSIYNSTPEFYINK
ncbi:hypothetical protein [Aerococcus sp. L_32]|uniref:hypothetical protein n=1 Tax=Aerococcus sp. L_32 TaxID=3422316 RepID=UPI003D6BF0B7